MESDPYLQYAVVRTLKDKGYFQQSEAEQEVVEDFLKACDEHLPKAHNQAVTDVRTYMDRISPASAEFKSNMCDITDDEAVSGVPQEKLDNFVKHLSNLMKF